ncbi:MAG TPA: hypothetical protein VMA55_13825, partial [Acidovorax sp.]|nr:hypothetical protein [Acidovorax sp.]
MPTSGKGAEDALAAAVAAEAATAGDFAGLGFALALEAARLAGSAAGVLVEAGFFVEGAGLLSAGAAVAAATTGADAGAAAGGEGAAMGAGVGAGVDRAGVEGAGVNVGAGVVGAAG